MQNKWPKGRIALMTQNVLWHRLVEPQVICPKFFV